MFKRKDKTKKLNFLKRIILKILKKGLGLLPEETLEFIYTTILKPVPLRRLTNKILTFLMPETVNFGEISVALNRKDKEPVVSGGLMLNVYETFETEEIKRRIKSGATVIDIGANIGYYTAIAANIVGNRGRVLAFEPDPESFSCLEKTIRINNFQNVKAFQLGLAEREGYGDLFVSGNRGDNRIYAFPEKRARMRIKLTTLDSFLRSQNTLKVDFIKMDVQGAEGLILRGMKETVKLNRHLKIFTEFWPLGLEMTGVRAADYLNELLSMGFKIFNINRKKGGLEEVRDTESFAKRFTGRQFANLYCEK